MAKFTKPKDWVAKLKVRHDLPKVVPIKPNQEKNWGKGTIAIPSPLEVDELMREVPAGKVTTINEIREKIAKKHKATIGCPITTGIFSCIAARAADQEKAAGKKEITPFWRTLKSDRSLNDKYPGGVSAQKKLLEAEGQKILQKGKKFYVLAGNN